MKYKPYSAYPCDSIYDMLERARNTAGTEIACKFNKKGVAVEVCYAEFCHDVSCLGQALTHLGLNGCHIACLSENRYKWINSYLTVLASKGVFVPVDRDLLEQDMISLIRHSDARVIFCSDRYEGFLRDRLDELENVEYIINFDREADDGKFLSFSALRRLGEELWARGERSYATLRRAAEDMAMLVYTSGSCDMQKGVMLSEENILSCLYEAAKLCRLEGRGLSMLRYSYCYEAICGILGSLYSRTTLCIHDVNENIGTSLKLYRPQYIFTVPALLESVYRSAMGQVKKSGKLELMRGIVSLAKTAKKLKLPLGKGVLVSLRASMGGELKKIICGGAPLRSEVAEFFELAGIDVIQGYGLAECSSLVSVNHDKQNDCHTVGLPLECLEIKIADPARDDNGEILVKGRCVMMGYYKDEAETQRVLDSDGWLVTGDRGHITAEGRLVITGRSKNLIALSNGRIVHPEEIEEYLYTIPYIKEVVVYGIKEEGGVRDLAAEIYLDPEKQLDDLVVQTDRLCRDVASVLSKHPFYKQVSRVVLRTQEFAKTSENKIKRGELGIQ